MEKNFDKILEGLNEEQRLAVSSVEGPLLIVAGAGSGKTRVLTSRIAYILEKGCTPDRILSLTFTKKAASEMKERIALMVGQKNARKLVMGTFHSVFIRFLREYAECIGYKKDFTIYDTSDSTSLIKSCLKEMNLDDKTYKPKRVLSRISMAKNNLYSANDYLLNEKAIQNDIRNKIPRLAELYLNYSNKCKAAGVMDFDDILLNMNILLKSNPAILEEIAGRFDYIMVDEYQDTNRSQYIILRYLSKFHKNICVVGDDSQSIYAFRGAKIENILNFKKDYSNSKTYKLEMNYRSTQNIVLAANSIIEKNSSRIPKNCLSSGEAGEKLKLINAYTEQEEAQLIAANIQSTALSKNGDYKDFAILYRTNAQARAIEDALRRKNIPYVIFSGNSFFERTEVKDMMAYIKLICNPQDDEAFKRVVNKPVRGIGNTSLEALKEAAKANGTSMFNAIYLDNLEVYGLKNAAVSKLKSFANMINDKISRSETEDAYKLANSIAMDSGIYMLHKSDTSIEAQTRAGNIEELLNGIKLYIEECNNEYFEELQIEDANIDIDNINFEDFPIVKLNEYLENISLLSAIDQGDDDGSKVTLMTVHSSKGLEYSYVYIAGMEENIFPSGSLFSVPSEAEIEEERRLFYVAVTRAKKEVSLAYAATRMRNGKHESNSPSRFLYEIDPKYLLNPTVLGRKTSTNSSASWSRFGSASGSATLSRDGGSSSSASWGQRRSLNSSYGSKVGASSSSGSSSGSSSSSVSHSSSNPTINSGQSKLKAVDPNFVSSSIIDIKQGSKIEHNKFGIGTVLELSGSPTSLKAKIDFEGYGEKIIMLAYAKVRVL